MANESGPRDFAKIYTQPHTLFLLIFMEKRGRRGLCFLGNCPIGKIPTRAAIPRSRNMYRIESNGESARPAKDLSFLIGDRPGASIKGGEGWWAHQCKQKTLQTTFQSMKSVAEGFVHLAGRILERICYRTHARLVSNSLMAFGEYLRIL